MLAEIKASIPFLHSHANKSLIKLQMNYKRSECLTEGRIFPFYMQGFLCLCGTIVKMSIFGSINKKEIVPHHRG